MYLRPENSGVTTSQITAKVTEQPPCHGSGRGRRDGRAGVRRLGTTSRRMKLVRGVVRLVCRRTGAREGLCGVFVGVPRVVGTLGVALSYYGPRPLQAIHSYFSLV